MFFRFRLDLIKQTKQTFCFSLGVILLGLLMFFGVNLLGFCWMLVFLTRFVKDNWLFSLLFCCFVLVVRVLDGCGALFCVCVGDLFALKQIPAHFHDV